MTLKILKSQLSALSYDFGAAVRMHIAALEEHRFSGNAAPHSFPEVEAVVRRVQYPIEEKKPDDFVADYEVVDDTPPPPTLAERKQAARADLQRQEQAEIDALMPPEKRRLHVLTVGRAFKADPKTPADEKIIAEAAAFEAALEAIAFKYAQAEAALADMA